MPDDRSALESLSLSSREGAVVSSSGGDRVVASPPSYENPHPTPSEVILDFADVPMRGAGEPGSFTDRPDAPPFGTVEGELPRVSLSQVLTWDRCRFLWKFKYQQHWTKIQKSYRIELGDMGHALLFDWYKTGIDHSADFANRWMSDFSNLDAEQIQNIATAVSAFKRYVEEFSPVEDRFLLTQSLEEYFEVELTTPRGRRYILEGYIDRTSVDQRGNLWVEDYKWTSRFWTPNQLLMDPQLSYYAGALRILGRPVHGLMITQVNTYPYKGDNRSKKKIDELIRRDKISRSPGELDTVLMEVGSTVDEMIDSQDNLHRSLRRECDRCDFLEPCLFGLKGIEPVQFLTSSGAYKKKEPRPPKETDSASDHRVRV